MFRLVIPYFFVIQILLGQWEQSTGTENLDTQSLLTIGDYNFMGGATGAYLSTDEGASYQLSNAGNDSNGPTRGFTFDSLYIYSCTSQGVFRSDNYGESWVPKNLGLSSLLSHGIINVHSRLVHAGPSGVSISSDHGDNWQEAGLSGTDVRCVTNIEDTLFVGTTGQGLYKSTDWGTTWIQINNGITSSNFRAIQSKGNILFAGGQTGTGVFRSDDYGSSWELLTNGISTAAYRGFANNDDLIIAGSTGAGVFYSLDNGDSWTEINDGLLDQTVFDLELNDNYIIAGTHSNGVFRYPLSGILPSIACNEGEVDLGWGDCNDWVNTFHSNGCMPSGCYSIESTTFIDLSDMSSGQVVIGDIPPEIGQLTNLTNLNLSINEISEEIPLEIGNLTSLIFLGLGGNQLSGQIPPNIGTLTSLTYLSLDGNQLTGNIPVSIGNLTNLDFLFLNNNQLTGYIPSEIGDLIDLGTLFLMNNQLTGIPESFCNLNPNFSVYLFNNYFCPPYPLCVQDNIGSQDTSNCNAGIQEVFNPATGRVWMDRNLGASQVATSASDDAAFGSLYQWGRGSDGHELRNSSTINITSSEDTTGHSFFILADSDWRDPPNDSLWQGINGINNPCPQSFRLPTEEEFEEERLSWTSNNAEGAFNSLLKLSLAGARSRMTGDIGNVGAFAGYRTSTVNGTLSRVLGIGQNNSMMGDRDRADGNCVRCIKDQQILGDYNIGLVNDFKLYDAYPNPFNPVTSISYDLPIAGLVNVTVYDIMGRIVKTLVNSSQSTGYKSIQWNATNDRNKRISAGLYMYTIQIGEFRQTRKIVLLK